MTVKEFYNRMKLLKGENANILLPTEYNLVNMVAEHIDYDEENNSIILSVAEED